MPAPTPITGINAHFVLDNASGTPTDISSYITRVTPTVNREEFPVKVFKATRVEKVAGFVEEDWDIVGPWSAEADAFWRPLAGETEGQGIDYILGPAGSTSGLTKFTGTLNVIQFDFDAIDSEGVMNYTARVSILDKTKSTF